MSIDIKQDLWHYLRRTDKPILLYGMGNGADKILAVMERYGIRAADFFASDGFVRGHSFHGKIVLSYSEAKEKYGSFLVLLSFATSRPDVLALIDRVAEENELYAPDVPVCGNTLFDLDFYEANRAAFDEATQSFADDESRAVLENLIRYKLTGDISYLKVSGSDEETVMRDLLRARDIREYVDLGAYTGDTVRKLLPLAPELRRVVAFEPDRRNYKKLSEYAAATDSISFDLRNVGAWSHPDTLLFDASGNRNANLSANAPKGVPVEVDTVDRVLGGAGTDFIKFDVEGSEAEALEGCAGTIRAFSPKLLVSVYHRSEDLFALPLLVRKMNPSYSLYLRKFRGVPAWDVNLFAIPKEK